MPIGPNGEKRPASQNANIIKMCNIIIGEEKEEYVDTARQAAGRKGGKARAEALTPEQRSEIARRGGKASKKS